MTRSIAISVVIPTFNRRKVLERTLPSVFAQDLPPANFEVIVVVDGSTDDTAQWLLDVKSQCGWQVIVQPNRGQAAARNAGDRAAAGDVLLFLDDDMLCDTNLLSSHLAAHEGHDSQLISGRLTVACESKRNFAASKMACDFEAYYSLLENGAEPHAWAGPNCSLPRKLFMKSGGYDESVRGFEDVEFGLRLRAMGISFRFQRNASASHIYAKTTLQAWRDSCSSTLFASCRKYPAYRLQSGFANWANESAWKSAFRSIALHLGFALEPALKGAVLALEALQKFSWVKRAGQKLLAIGIGLGTQRASARHAGSIRALFREFRVKLPVLLYHRVGPHQLGSNPSLTISPAKFESQIRWLARRGYQSIKPADWLAWQRHGAPLPEKPVLITFDDAYADLAEYAFPILERYGFGAVVYIVTRRLGTVNDWFDHHNCAGTLRTMSESDLLDSTSRGIEFGAHSRTHPDLTELNASDLTDEIIGSQRDFVDIFGAPPDSFAYPYGSYNEPVEAIASNAFPLAMTCDEGLNNLRTPSHLVRRLVVNPNDTLIEFASKVCWGTNPIGRVRSRLRLRARLKQALRFVTGQ